MKSHKSLCDFTGTIFVQCENSVFLAVCLILVLECGSPAVSVPSTSTFDVALKVEMALQSATDELNPSWSSLTSIVDLSASLRVSLVETHEVGGSHPNGAMKIPLHLPTAQR